MSLEEQPRESLEVCQGVPPEMPRLRPLTIEDSITSLLDISTPSQTTVEQGIMPKQVSSSLSALNNATTSNSTFGSRLLTDPSKVNDFNAWDHVEWDDAHLEEAERRISFQMANPVPSENQDLFGDNEADGHWNRFYDKHEEGFFKDRKWIKLEFPELVECTVSDAGEKVIADVGCAVGNTVYPLLRMNHNPALMFHALDFSSQAIKIVRSTPEFDETHISTSVWDMADPHGPPPSVPDSSVDIIVLIFAFSALSPGQWTTAISNLRRMLKPGGLLLMRDYGRFDLTQLRLKANRLLSESFYIRGDGTRVYYFTNEELSTLFSIEQGWVLEQNAIDKRLIVNRKLEKKMYRAWVQIKARKI